MRQSTPAFLKKPKPYYDTNDERHYQQGFPATRLPVSPPMNVIPNDVQRRKFENSQWNVRLKNPNTRKNSTFI